MDSSLTRKADRVDSACIVFNFPREEAGTDLLGEI